MLSNNGSCLRAHSCAVRVTIFSNGSIILPGFKFTKLHALTLATRSYALLPKPNLYNCSLKKQKDFLSDAHKDCPTKATITHEHGQVKWIAQSILPHAGIQMPGVKPGKLLA